MSDAHPVLRLERERCRALEAGDIDAVAALLSPRLVYVHAPGTVNDRDELLDFLRTRVRFRTVQRAGVAVVERDDVAWTTGFMRLEGTRTATGEDFMSSSFVTQIWCREADAWRLVLFQSTRVDDALWFKRRRADSA